MNSSPTSSHAPRGDHSLLLPILAVALAIRLVNVHGMAQHPMAEYQFRATESDMAFTYEWSGRILHGDLLGREPAHEYTRWMQEIAPLETWERWWGGEHVFHQAPLYAYTLAGFRLVAGDRFWQIAICQALLGVANVALVFALAGRVFGGAVPALAALGAAFYGPLQLHELFILRDTLGVTVSLLMLWALARCDTAAPRRWLLAGVLFALAVLTREATLLFGPFVGVWIVRRFRGDGRAMGRAGLGFLVGLALGLAPLVVRNVLVGAPAFSLSTRGIETFIHGNAPGSAGFGFRLPAATRTILEQADGHLATGIRLTLASYGGEWRQLLALETLKLRAIFARYEALDNVNWYYFADFLPLLRFSLRFDHVLALGLIGLWLARSSRAWHGFLVYFLVAAVGGMMYSTIVSRYRLPATAVLLVYAAVAVNWAGEQIARRNWRALAVAGVAGVAIMLASANLLRSAELRMRYWPREFWANAGLYYQRGEVDRACDELRTGLEKAYTLPDRGVLPPQYITLLAQPYASLGHTLHRDSEVAAVLEGLAASYQADADLQELIGVVYRDGLGRPEQAAQHFERARQLRGH